MTSGTEFRVKQTSDGILGTMSLSPNQDWPVVSRRNSQKGARAGRGSRHSLCPVSPILASEMVSRIPV